MMYPGPPLGPKPTQAEKVAHTRAFMKWVDEEQERIRRQRIYLTTLAGPLRDAMIKRMLDRAWALLDAGEAEAADALLEFVPRDDAVALLEEFFKE